MKNLIVSCDLPYPSLTGLTQDRCSANIISPAYATTNGELNAILQYIYQSHFFADCFPEIAELIMGIAKSEMHHLDILGETLMMLGVAPVYSANPPETCRFYNASCVSYATDPQKMLMDDISGELNAIRMYKDMQKKLCNQQVQAIIGRIILDEELHVEKLKCALNTVIAEKAKCHTPNCGC